MKILVILPSLRRTGPVNVALEILKQSSDDTIVDIYALSDGDGRKYFEEHANRVLVSNRTRFSLLFITSLDVDLSGYDLVHSHCLIPDFIVSRLGNIKKISTLHCYLDDDYIAQYGRVLGGLLAKIHMIFLKKMNCIVACSTSVSTHMSSVFNTETKVIPNGVARSTFLDEQREVTSDEVKKPVTFISVGVLNKRKNTEVLIEAFSRLDTDSKLLVVGTGPLKEELECKFEQNTNIKFLGHCDNVREIMSKSDVFVSSSTAEGLPMALLESMSEGLTYIVSDISPHKEIYDKCCMSGILVSQENDFKYGFEAILNSNEHMLKEFKSRSQIVFGEYYDSKIMSLSYEKVYREIVAFGD